MLYKDFSVLQNFSTKGDHLVCLLYGTNTELSYLVHLLYEQALKTNPDNKFQT